MEKLTVKQEIELLNLIAQMASLTTIERRLGVSKGELEAFKRDHNIVSQIDARKECRRLADQHKEKREAFESIEVKKAREAEMVAQARLDQINKDKSVEKPPVKIDVSAIKAEQVERQHRLDEKLDEQQTPKEEWHLLLEGSKEARAATIDQFRKDIVYRGFSFCKAKYDAGKLQIQYEARRLGLDINWDLVKR